MSNELEISYMNFLSKTLKQFNNSKYQLAAERFEAILEKYPDDVNALFYQSICYFNMNQYELAVSKFKRLEMSFYTNFQQDQEWYLMLCYKALGKHKLFRNQKNQIIARNGFYILRAQKTKFN